MVINDHWITAIIWFVAGLAWGLIIGALL